MTSKIIHSDSDPFLTTKEAAQRLGVTLRAVQLWVNDGKLPAARTPGGHRRIRSSDVQALQEQMGIKPAKAVVLLTDEQIDGLIAMHWGDVGVPMQSVADFARRVQALALSVNGLEAPRA